MLPYGQLLHRYAGVRLQVYYSARLPAEKSAVTAIAARKPSTGMEGEEQGKNLAELIARKVRQIFSVLTEEDFRFIQFAPGPV